MGEGDLKQLLIQVAQVNKPTCYNVIAISAYCVPSTWHYIMKDSKSIIIVFFVLHTGSKVHTLIRLGSHGYKTW